MWVAYMYIYTHNHTYTHIHFNFFLIGAAFQSSGKLVGPASYPFSQPALGDWHGVRGHLLSALQPMHSRREKEALRNYGNLCLWM